MCSAAINIRTKNMQTATCDISCSPRQISGEDPNTEEMYEDVKSLFTLKVWQYIRELRIVHKTARFLTVAFCLTSWFVTNQLMWVKGDRLKIRRPNKMWLPTASVTGKIFFKTSPKILRKVKIVKIFDGNLTSYTYLIIGLLVKGYNKTVLILVSDKAVGPFT